MFFSYASSMAKATALSSFGLVKLHMHMQNTLHMLLKQRKLKLAMKLVALQLHIYVNIFVFHVFFCFVMYLSIYFISFTFFSTTCRVWVYTFSTVQSLHTLCLFIVTRASRRSANSRVKNRVRLLAILSFLHVIKKLSGRHQVLKPHITLLNKKRGQNTVASVHWGLWAFMHSSLKVPP